MTNPVHPCFTVINATLAVVHTLKPSSSFHSLQIYCTGFTGPRSHSYWAWAAKRDPTKTKLILGFFIYIDDISWFT